MLDLSRRILSNSIISKKAAITRSYSKQKKIRMYSERDLNQRRRQASGTRRLVAATRGRAAHPSLSPTQTTRRPDPTSTVRQAPRPTTSRADRRAPPTTAGAAAAATCCLRPRPASAGVRMEPARSRLRPIPSQTGDAAARRRTHGPGPTSGGGAGRTTRPTRPANATGRRAATVVRLAPAVVATELSQDRDRWKESEREKS